MTSEAPRRAGGSYEAIVVGGGHNGVTCAAYLARAGLRTLLLERREQVGGAAATDELLPGVRVPTVAHTVGRLRPSIVRDLRLRDYRLQLVQPEVRAFAPRPDGPAVVLRGDPARTAAGLSSWAPKDAAAYPAFDAHVRRLARFMSRLMATTPPDLASPRPGELLSALQLGLDFRALGRSGGRDLLRLAPMPVADLVAEWFESDALRAALATRGVRYTALGTRSAGTTLVLLADSAPNDAGAAGATVFARGGPGAVADALVSAARGFGAEVRTGAEVVAITARDGRVAGVALESGEEIAAPIVVSGVDPRRTLLRLVDPAALEPTLLWRMGNYRMPGMVAKVNLALRGLPRFAGAGEDDASLLRGRILVAPGTDALERAFDAAKYGRLPDAPHLEATIPSLVDPGLVDRERAPAVRHVMSVLVQYAPSALKDGGWESRREELGDLTLRTLDRYAPGLTDLVEARQVLTPLDLERDYGLAGGHPLHGEPGPDQISAWRPLVGHAR